MVSRWLFYLCAVLIVIIMLLVGYSVVTRYFFNNPQPWIDELTGYLMVATALLGAAETLRRREHINVDMVAERLGPTGKRRMEIFGLLAVMILSLCMAVSGIDMVVFAYSMDLYSIGYLELPIWIPQLVVPAGFGLLGLVAATQLSCMLFITRGKSV